MQKQKIDAYYLKLIGVTLMMTATCVADGNNKRGLTFAEDNVREIILEQFQLLSSGHLAEVIEWDNAIKHASELPIERFQTLKATEYKVVETKGSLPDFNAESIGVKPESIPDEASCCTSYYAFNDALILQNRNKYSLVTRAGPLV